MLNDTVSIIVPIYNKEKYLEKCLPTGRQIGWRNSTVCSVTDIPML